MALSDLAVFSEYTVTAMNEVLAQQIDLFNAATRGAIALRGAAHAGDYSDLAFWARISGLVRRRNAYGTGNVSEKSLEHLLETMVKVAAGTPPVRIDPGMFEWIQRNPEEGGVVIGRQLAEDTLADMLNTALTAYVAAVAAVSTNYRDLSGSGNLSFAAFNTGQSLYGDRSADLSVWVMHSKPMFDMFGTALANSAGLFSYGTVNIKSDPFGRPIIVTDSPALIEAGSPAHYLTCGLTAGAIRVDQNGDFTDNMDTTNGKENIVRTYQAEWSYNLGLKGFAWDKTNGGKSPTDAALGTGTNWDMFATSPKDLAGILIETT